MELKEQLLQHHDKKQPDETEVTSRLLNLIFDMPVSQQLKLLEMLDSQGYEGGRRHERTPLKSPWVVVVDHENETNDSYIKDISRCGMFIRTQRSFTIGEKIALKFQVPSSKRLFKIIGEVVRCRSEGVGVKFKRQLL